MIGRADANLSLPADLAWRLFSNNLERSTSVLADCGDPEIAAAFVQTRAILG